jgi:hypothetical protein
MKLFLLYIVFNPCILYAYVDPGSGSYFFQVLIATILGFLYVIKLYWKRIIEWTRNKFSKDE